MDQAKLDVILDGQPFEEAAEDGRFAIFFDDDDGRSEEKYYIRANEEGLRLVAYQLLCAARDLKVQTVNKEYQTVKLMTDEDKWIDKSSEVVIRYVEPLEINSKQARAATKETWKHRAAEIGCGLLGIFLLISLVVGIVEVLTYLTWK